MVRRISILALLASLAFVGCGGGGSPTSPSNSQIPILLLIGPLAGTFSVSLNGQTYTAPGAFPISLSVGSHEASGTFTGAGGRFVISFGSNSTQLAGGGVQSGSVQSLAGPAAIVAQCSVQYDAIQGAPVVFRVRFSVAANPNSACQVGG